MSKSQENKFVAGPLANGSTIVRVTDHASRVTECFHCHDPISAHVPITTRIGDKEESFCCHGCRAVAEWITGAGLSDYYRFRETPGRRAEDETRTQEWLAFDQPELLAQLSRGEPNGERSATLTLDGIGCAACGWLIDRMLKREPGVCAVNVNAATARMNVRWRPEDIRFSRLLERLAQLGYRPHPVSKSSGVDRVRDERRGALKRLAVAGLGMMQVMMFAVALYASDWGDDAMDERIEAFLRHVSLLCATPVLFYSGKPFLLAAWRALRARAVVMDVPVSIALVLAYSASVWNTLGRTGEVYFDSVTMFVFFLTLGRFVEMTARHRTGDVVDALARLLPVTAHRIGASGAVQEIPVTALRRDDRILIRSGEVIPADGVVIEGVGRVDESMLTGESLPVARGVGDLLIAGSMNLHSPLTVRVTAIGQDTVLSGIVRLLDRAEQDKAPQATAADRAASWFLGRILVGAGVVAASWLLIDPSRAFEATLAVLVVTCPCALSLATPTALTAAIAALAKRGVLVAKASALEQLAKITRVAFDKTGTLTYGQPVVEHSAALGALSSQRCLEIARALEQASEHPIARAFRGETPSASTATDVIVVPGAGVEGVVDGMRYRIGRREFVSAMCAVATPSPLRGEGGGEGGKVGMPFNIPLSLSLPHEVRENATLASSQILLGDANEELASFTLGDRLRNEASDVVAALQARKLHVEILSGDAWGAVAEAATRCGIDHYKARQSPADKLDHVRELSGQGECVAMVGDGINDAPVLKGAAVSIAMSRASALAQVSADIVLIGDSLKALPDAIDIANRVQRIIKQNLAWAATYNMLALPLAAFGYVPPWLAAIGMSFSSIVVVMNALRLAPRAHAVKTRDREIVRRNDPELSTLRSSDLTPSRIL